MKIPLLNTYTRSERDGFHGYTFLPRGFLFRGLCLFLTVMIMLGSVGQASSAGGIEIEEAEKKLRELAQNVKELREKIAEDDRLAKQYALKNLPEGAAKKIVSMWETLMFYLLKGIGFLALLASPIMAVKHLLTGYLVGEMAITEDEIKLLDTANEKYESAKREVDKINLDIATNEMEIQKEKNCMLKHSETVSEVKQMLLKADPYEKAQRELERAANAARLAAKAREDTRAALAAAKDSKVKAEAAAGELKRQEELTKTIKKECEVGKDLVKRTQAAQKAASKHFIEMADYYGLTENEWKKACAAAARLRQTHLLSQDDIDLLEVSSMQATVLSQDASSECADKAKMVTREAEKAGNMGRQIEKIEEKIAELNSQLKDGTEINAKLDTIMAEAEAKVKETQDKALEAEIFAATAEDARDKVADILSKIIDEDRAKKMTDLAKETAETSKTAAIETESFATETRAVIKALKPELETLRERASLLAKKKTGCKISSVAELVKDAHASKDSAEMFARKAADFAIEAERCAAFVSMVARDPKRGFDLKIRSIKPIVSNMLEYDPKPVKNQAGQNVDLYIEYVVFGRPRGEVKVDIDPVVMIGIHPMSLNSIKRNVRFGEKEIQKVYQDTLKFSIPYPTRSEERESFHDLQLDLRINGNISNSVVVKRAFGVIGPGTDFNGYTNLGICVIRSDKDKTPDAYGGTKSEKPYEGKVEVNLQPLSRHAASIRKVLENDCFMPEIVFKKIPLGRYLITAIVQGDKGLRGAKSGSNLVTVYKPHPEAGYNDSLFHQVVIQLGKSRGEKRPSFAKPKKPKDPEKPIGPEAWFVQIKVEDMKRHGITGAVVFTSDGAMTAKERGGGKYLLGPIKNVKNISEKIIEVTADISFKSAHPSLLGHNKKVPVVLKDKAHVYATIKFDDYEEGKTGLGGFSGSSGAGTPSWVPKKPDVSKGQDTTGSERPSWAGRRKSADPSDGTGTGGDKGISNGTGSGEGKIAKRRSREECERKFCSECFFMGQRIDRSGLPKGGSDPCKECLQRKASLIKKCMEGKL